MSFFKAGDYHITDNNSGKVFDMTLVPCRCNRDIVEYAGMVYVQHQRRRQPWRAFVRPRQYR